LTSTPAPVASRPLQAPKSYLNKNTVQLPIVLDERVRPLLQEVQLVVKEGPNAPWTIQEKVPGTEKFFTYKAPKDGEYWFNVVTVDRQGRSVPADVKNEPPALVVVIDTANPIVNIIPLETNPQGQIVQCEAQDPNLEGAKVKFFFQSGDKNWRPLDPMPDSTDKFCIPTQAVFTGMVRAQVNDLAGNTTTKELNLTALAAAPMQKAPPVSVLNESPSQILEVVQTAPPGSASPGSGVVMVNNAGEKVILVSPPGTTAPNPPPTNQVVPNPMTNNQSSPPVQSGVKAASQIEDRGPNLPASGVEVVVHKQAVEPRIPQETNGPRTPSSMLPLGGPNADPATKREPGTGQRQLLNQTHAFLDFEIERTGASGVGKVEIWITRDQGQSWQKGGETNNHRGPAEFDLPGEGLFGVSLVVANGRGFGGNPPQPGDRPDTWIEVDMSKPSAEIMSVRPSGANDGALIISWQAKDKNLADNPVDLLFALKREGPWLPVARNLKNDGSYRWSAPGDAGAAAYLRLVVRDQAGNVTHCETLQPVALDDLSRPRGRVLGVSTQPRPGAGTISLVPDPTK
jgi:hypothetical protein